MFKIERLSKAVEWISKDDIVADIGCDHGYLAIEALNKGVSFVQLIDNKESPLNTARSNISKFGYENRSLLTLGYGLDEIDLSVNTVCILGMGGELITNILKRGMNKISNVNKFILGANTKVPFLREYLMNNNYHIIDEAIVYENNQYYELILCKKCSIKNMLSEKDLLLGPILSSKKSPIFVKKWTSVYNHYLDILSQNLDIESIKKESELIKSVLWPE